MAENAFIKIGTALLKHQVMKLVGEEAMGAIGAELAGIGGDKLDAWLGDKSTIAEIEKAAILCASMLPWQSKRQRPRTVDGLSALGNLPKVVEALEELPKSPDETKLENALQILSR